VITRIVKTTKPGTPVQRGQAFRALIYKMVEAARESCGAFRNAHQQPISTPQSKVRAIELMHLSALKCTKMHPGCTQFCTHPCNRRKAGVGRAVGHFIDTLNRMGWPYLVGSLRKAGLKPRQSYQLRHTFASLRLQKGRHGAWLYLRPNTPRSTPPISDIKTVR
jgi:hypothetical protein